MTDWNSDKDWFHSDRVWLNKDFWRTMRRQFWNEERKHNNNTDEHLRKISMYDFSSYTFLMYFDLKKLKLKFIFKFYVLFLKYSRKTGFYRFFGFRFLLFTGFSKLDKWGIYSIEKIKTNSMVYILIFYHSWFLSY